MSDLRAVSAYAVPLLIALVGAAMLFSRRAGFDAFLAGAREGLRMAVQLLPTLVALLVAVGMLRASGAIEAVCRLLAPLTSRLGVPGELLPLLLTRPFSGSAATASFADLLASVEADGAVARMGAVILGSSDTAVYVISVYFSSVGVRRGRYALPVALLLSLFCIFFSCFLCRLCLGKA